MRILTVLLAALLILPAAGQAGLDVEKVVARNTGAVAVLKGVRRDTGAEVQSSGCCIHPDGYILTTAHQISGVEQLEARLQNGEIYPLTVVRLETSKELALLKTDRPLPAASAIGDARTLRSGAPLVSIAAPRSLDFTTVTGIVSNTNRLYNGYPAIQADMRASPGSSGGPVFDRNGDLVGLIIGKLRDEDWITVVNPVNNAWPLLKEYGIPLPAAETTRKLPDEVDTELVPAAGISEKDLHAVQAYNRGVRAETPEEKQEAYKLAVTLLPEFFEAWFNLAVSSMALGDAENAEKAYLKAGALKPDAVAVYRNLGRLYLRIDAPDKALNAFEKAAELAPDAAQSHNDIGEACRRLEKYPEAIEAFERALAIQPDHGAARYNLALSAAGAGRADLAVTHFRIYLEQYPDAGDAAQVKQWIAELSEKQ